MPILLNIKRNLILVVVIYTHFGVYNNASVHMLNRCLSMFTLADNVYPIEVHIVHSDNAIATVWVNITEDLS